MQEMHSNVEEQAIGFPSREWKRWYKGSSINAFGRPDNILHDFYIPALQLAVKYDRIAGYFRASSLAAASQGFSSFVGRNGTMRLVVGADLDPEDVKAILDGDKQRLVNKLNDELGRETEWPEDVTRGVTLLAWMIAHGYLEVRVAFRKHAQTGEPIPYDSHEDGYFHEKWFIMTDEVGNRIYGSGSINESKTALVHNFENLDIEMDWMGDLFTEKVEQSAQDFERIWKSEHPLLAVRKLPDAVRERLIRLADGITIPQEIDGTRPKVTISTEPSTMDRLRFAILRDAPKMPGGRWVGLSTAPVDPWPHQEIVVRRLVETWPYSYLLCDEVGLGKTIEAGLAFRCLYLSGIVRRILVAAPASLTVQWQRQMASKVLLPFGRAEASPRIEHDYLLPVPHRVEAPSLFNPDLVIISTGLLSRLERAETLRFANPFDIVLVDEAHAARRSNATEGTAAHPEYVALYRHLRDFVRPATQSLWLATATPMQLHPIEVCDLIALTHRVGPFQFAPRLTLEYYGILGRLLNGERLDETEWTFLRKSVDTIPSHDPFLWEYLNQGLIPRIYNRVLDQWVKEGRIPRRRDLETLQRILFSVAPLSRVMMRHTRQLLEIYRQRGQLQQNLAKRHIQPLKSITFTAREKRIYDRLENYCRGLNEQLGKNATARSRNMMQFFLSFLRLRFASSLYAIEQTLQRRLRRVEATLAHQLDPEESRGVDEEDLAFDLLSDDESEGDIADVEALLKDRSTKDLEWEREQLHQMLTDLAQISERPSKMQELLSILDRRKRGGRIDQTVVFTRFFDTLRSIVEHLRATNPTMRIGTYSGQGAEFFDPEIRTMRTIDREEVKSLFLRGEIDVLVCTDAAAEGLNLQTADMLINFDLGWNPMKIEQRIGRIDRIGQRHDHIYVVNLCYTDSAEEFVYARLLERLQDANLVVGSQQLSLLPVTPDDFRRLAERSISEEELEAVAMDRAREQQERIQRMELPARDVYDMYTRMTAERQKQEVPVDRKSLWQAITESSYLQRQGCQLDGEETQTFVVHGIDNIPNGTRFTISPELYETGLPGWEGRLHFASYGDPHFDALLDHMNRYDLPPCIRRVHVRVGGDDRWELVAYAVAHRTTSGTVGVTLVRSWRDLDGLEIAEGETIDDTVLEPLRNELQRIARNEFHRHMAVGQIERENVKSANLQRLLELSVVTDLMEVCSDRMGEQPSTNAVFREIETLYESRSTIQAEVPVQPFKDQKLLFDLRLQTVPERANVSVPIMLAEASLDTAKALADSLKMRRGSVPLRTLLTRLKREVSDLNEVLRGMG